MKPNEFSVIKVHSFMGEYFFRGGFKRRKFSWLCRLLRIPSVVPALTKNQEEAEFHLSPIETEEEITRLRATYPKYQWYYDTVILPKYTNEAMLPRFCIIVKMTGRTHWRYYRDGASDKDYRIKFTPNLSEATFMNLDEAKNVSECMHINHKEWHYQVIPTPSTDVHADCLGQYLIKNPPKPMYMTFNLRTKRQ